MAKLSKCLEFQLGRFVGWVKWRKQERSEIYKKRKFEGEKKSIADLLIRIKIVSLICLKKWLLIPRSFKLISLEKMTTGNWTGKIEKRIWREMVIVKISAISKRTFWVLESVWRLINKLRNLRIDWKWIRMQSLLKEL